MYINSICIAASKLNVTMWKTLEPCWANAPQLCCREELFEPCHDKTFLCHTRTTNLPFFLPIKPIDVLAVSKTFKTLASLYR